MKNFRTVALLVFGIGLLFAMTSCAVIVPGSSARYGVVKKDNGKHNGWYKNQNNPHNPNSTSPKNNGKQKK